MKSRKTLPFLPKCPTLVHLCLSSQSSLPLPPPDPCLSHPCSRPTHTHTHTHNTHTHARTRSLTQPGPRASPVLCEIEVDRRGIAATKRRGERIPVSLFPRLSQYSCSKPQLEGRPEQSSQGLSLCFSPSHFQGLSRFFITTPL